jgi:phytoene dehydrogenase-like protein
LKIGIIGAGLGGLLVGVSLLKRGHEVEIFERLPYPGGRFTNIEYKGYQLSTGALHMIPHGKRGPLAKMLDSLGLDVEIVQSNPEGYFRVNGEDYLFSELKDLLPFTDKIRATFILTLLKYGRGGDESYRSWLENKIKNPLIFQVADSFCGWSLSLNSNEISSREVISITKNIYRFGGPGIPVGGCKGVSGALAEEFENMGGRIHYRTKVERILVEGQKVEGITAGDDYRFDVVVSDIGPKATVKLCGRENFSSGYLKIIDGVRSVGGIKISIACDKPMLGHTGVLFTPQARRIDGLNEVTNADPSLAPEGKHLLMSHQALNPQSNVKSEIQLAKKDLKELFPDFDKHCKVLTVQVYRGEWPVNRVASGTYVDPVSPIEGLYYVGDAIKPRGWMETEGVAAGVEIVLDAIAEHESF